MSVQLALRQLSGGNNLPSVSQLAIQARRIATLEALLKEAMTDIDARIGAAGLRLQEAEAETGLAFDTFSRDLVSGKFAASVEVKDAMALALEMDRLKASGLQAPLRAAIESARPMRQWVGDFGEKVGPHIEAVRELQSLADRVRPRVLIVDDDPLQLRLVSVALAQEGYDLDTTLSGTGALKLAQKRRPDLILLDVNLPDMSGIEVLQRLKASPQCSGVPVVMLTGNSERQVVLDCMQAGAISFVVKPVDRVVLTSRLSEFIQAGKGQG
jgi:CheY-like chemotaxis protein